MLGAMVLLLSPLSPSDVIAMLAGWMRGVLGWGEFRQGWIEFPANVLLFVPMGLLLTLLVRRPWSGALVAVLLSVCAELVQTLLPARVASLRDVIANALGAVIGAGMAWLVIRHRRARPTETTRAR